MSALVPYGPSLVLTKRRYQALSTAAPYIKKYGPKVMKYAANKIQKAYRARKYKRRRIGRPLHSSSAKTSINTIDSTSTQTWDNRTLYWFDMSGADKSTNNEINRRQRDIMQLRGFKVCMSLHNTGVDPCLVNIAVISPKGINSGLGTGGSGNATNIPDFFRGHANDRAIDFNTGISAMQFHCLPINTDRWNVLAHSRFTMAPEGGTGEFNTQQGPNYKTWMRYYKINRQIRFRDTGQSENPVYFCYWYDRFQAISTVIAGTQTDIGAQREFVTYFREPRQ